MNPCDKYVANKNINGSQCTILWHVDYLKTSHMESKVVDDIINMLNLKIWKRGSADCHSGKVKWIPGNDNKFSSKGKIIIWMDNYVILFWRNERKHGRHVKHSRFRSFVWCQWQSTNFWEKTKQYFITMTNMFLFLSKRARPDLQEAVAFLSMVVNVPTMYDYKNFSGSSDIWEGNTKHP